MVVAGSLAVVLIALFALLLLYGGQTLATLLSRMIPSINLGFYHVNLGALVKTGATAALHAVESLFDAAVGPVVAVITAPAYVFNWTLDQVGAAIAEAVTTARWLVTSYVPRVAAGIRALMSAVQTNLVNLIAATAAQVRNYAAGLVSDLHALLSAVQTNLAAAITAGDAAVVALMSRVQVNLQNLIAATGQQAADYARALVADTQRWVGGQIAALDARINATAATAATDLGAAVGQVERDITAAANAATAGAIGIISTDIEHAAAAAWGDLDAAVSGAINVAAGDFADVVARLRAISLADVTDIAGVTALSTAVAGALTRYLEECGMPNCRNLSGVGRALQDLFALFEGGAFLALLAAMIADPKGMAAEVESVLGPIAGGIADTARGLLDVA